MHGHRENVKGFLGLRQCTASSGPSLVELLTGSQGKLERSEKLTTLKLLRAQNFSLLVAPLLGCSDTLQYTAYSSLTAPTLTPIISGSHLVVDVIQLVLDAL
jgi:hypothetical protein